MVAKVCCMISGQNPENSLVSRADPKHTMSYRGQPKRHAMKKPTRRDARVVAAATSAEAPTTLKLENTPMSDIIHALASGRVTATALTRGYLARIEAYDRDGPVLNSVREL